MGAIGIPAAQRLNASVAGFTGHEVSPLVTDATSTGASATEALASLPTEFGELTHLFGGSEPVGSTQYAPVQTPLQAPGGIAGAYGGVKQDVRAAVSAATEAVRPPAAVKPVSVYVTQATNALRRAFGLKP